MRQQTTKLAAEGWLQRSHRRHGAGRPADEWTLSAEGRRRFANGDDDVLSLVLNELKASAGPEVASTVLKRVGARLVERMRDGVGEGPVDRRIQRLAGLFQKQGLVIDAESGATRLQVFTCPYPETSNDHPHFCEMERKAIEELLGADIELNECLREGGHCCSFQAKGAPAGAAVATTAVE